MSIALKIFLIYFSCLINVVYGIWWFGTEPTTETEPPILNAVTSEEHYFEDKILQYDFVVPGTKYCGPGNRSTDPNDLGRFKFVDACCRDHDNCPENIHAGKYKYGLHNRAKFTKYDILLQTVSVLREKIKGSHCSCDETFHHCLRDIGTPPARLVGALYFTIFRINCFKKEHPVLDCTRRRFRRCLEYKLNFTDTPVYQWFDNPFFRHWVDQFPPEMMNMTLLYLNATATTPMNTIDTTESILNLNMSEFNITLTDSNGNKVNSTNVASNVSIEASTASYFGGYIYSFYEAASNYLYNLTTLFANNIETVEVTTVMNILNTTNTNNTVLDELDFDTNSNIDFYVLN